MSRSIHTSRAKFRKASRVDYSTPEERTRVLGKIIDELGLKRDVKENARRKKEAAKHGIKDPALLDVVMGIAWKKAPPSDRGKEVLPLVRIRKGRPKI